MKCDPDYTLLMLEECVGWEQCGRLAEVAAAIGVPDDPGHALLGTATRRPSGRRYHVALVSRSPLLRSQVHTPRDVAHCIVEAELELDGAPLVALGAHLHANDEDSRLAEVDELLAIASPDAVRTGHHILCGDLNALAAHDPYPPDLDECLTRAGVHKYGHPPRFEVMDRLFAAGWIDALHLRPRSGRWVTARRARGDGDAAVDTRTDYVLVSPLLAPRVAWADVIEVGQASDHHAVIAELI